MDTLNGSADWTEFLKQQQSENVVEVNLTDLATGDQLVVLTENTNYAFKILEDNVAEMQSSRADRPNGQVTLRGSVFGRSSTIRPSVVFCGGNLEFLIHESHTLFTTTAIRGIQVIKAIRP